VPKFLLSDVKALVQKAIDGDESAVWFSGRSRSIDYVIHVYQCDETYAANLVLNGLMSLQEQDFVNSVIMSSAPDLVVADEYGLENYNGHNWYIKFFIESDDAEKYLTSISFHPVERTLKRCDGRNLDVTLDIAKQFKINKKK
jgi:hypothetical protein